MSELKFNEDGDIDLTDVGQDPIQNPNEDIQDPEPVQEPTAELTEPVVEPEPEPVQEPDPSSLTPQPQPEPPLEEPVVNQITIDDTSVTAYLSEKLGKDVVLEELLKEPETMVNPLDQDPALKEIYEWRQRTGRPVEDWVKFQKDYDSMSNLDVAREILQLRYPDLTEQELQLEMSNFIAAEDDLEQDVTRKSLNLKKFAIDGRKELNGLKSKFNDVLPNMQGSISDVDKQKIDFYDTYEQQKQQQEQVAQKYQQDISNEISQFKSIPLKLSDEMSIDYNVTPENKNSLAEFMAMKHWYNQDGSYNHNAVVADSVFLQNKDKIIQMAYEQGVAKGKETEDIESRNITLNQPRQTMDNLNAQTDDIIVEGAESFAQTGTKIRFKKR